MRQLRWSLFSVGLLVLAGACGFSPFFAPEDAQLIITTDKTYLQTGGDTARITVIGFSSSNQILRDHTRVILTTTLGTLPPYVDLIEGRAEADFVSGDDSGEAEIMAFSGSVEAGPLVIAIGTAGLEELVLQANPMTLAPGGGDSDISVFAFGSQRKPLAGIPVTITATQGSFERGGVLYTDANGRATDSLYTTKTSTLRANCGSVESNEVVISVSSNLPPTASFSYSPSDPKVGDTVYFNASASTDSDGHITSYEWDFGDGNLGAGRTTTHVYTVARKYKVILRVTDNNNASDTDEKEITILSSTVSR